MSIESVSPSDKNSFGGVGCHLNWDLGSNIKIFPAPQEEINILGNGMTITNNDQTPSLLDHTDFGSILVCAGPITRTYTIENTGTGNLQVTGIAISPSGPNPFIITTNVPNNQQIAPNSAFQFTVSFAPGASGQFSSLITITNDDDDEGSYVFAITGTGLDDLTSPTITCPGNITTSCGPNACSAFITYTTPIANDNCPGFSTSKLSGISSNQIVPAGVHPTVWQVTDGAGRTSTCSFIVTVTDNQIPTAECHNATVAIDQNSIGSLDPNLVDNGSTDNCSFTRSISITSFTCSQVGTSQAVTLTITDASGNSATCTAQVSIVDNLPPSATCQNATVQLPPNGPATITASMLENGSTDNCGSTVASINQTNLNCNNVGTNSIIVTVTDGSGNTATCTATVILEDLTPPVANCGSITATLNAQGSVTITAQDVDNGSTDNCEIDTRSVSQTTFGCADVGQQTVELTVSDASGNTSSCYATLHVRSQILNASATPAFKTCNTHHISCRGGSDGVANATANSSCPGLAFYWSNGQIGPTATGLQAGTYTVTITDIPSGDTLMRTVTLTEPPTSISVSANQTAYYCLEDSNGAAIASATGGTICSPNLYTYHWSTGANTAPVQNAPPGTYTVTATDAQGCTATQSIAIVSHPVPVPTFTNNGSYLAADQNWDSLQWYLNGSPIIGAINLVLNNLQVGGTYTLHVFDNHGCHGESGPMVITRIDEPPLSAISIYPNPNHSGLLYLSSKLPISGAIEIRILDFQGRVLLSQHLSDWSEPIVIDVRRLARGSYLIEMLGDGMRIVRRWAAD